jgi:hypothetical protein
MIEVNANLEQTKLININQPSELGKIIDSLKLPPL